MKDVDGLPIAPRRLETEWNIRYRPLTLAWMFDHTLSLLEAAREPRVTRELIARMSRIERVVLRAVLEHWIREIDELARDMGK